MSTPPYQLHQPPPIALSQDKHALVTQEVQELLTKGAIVKTLPSPISFVSQIFLVEKKRGQQPVINLKALNQFVQVEHFKMEGLHLLPDLLQQGDWMVKRRLPPNPYPLKSTPPPIHLGGEALQVSVPPIWPLLSITNIHETAETSNGF